jgi:hypothetical protein
MGTGSASDSARKSLGPRGVWRDGFIFRLVRSFLSSMDGEDTWQQLCNQLPKEVREKYFRFNIRFDGSEPAIDDVDRMQELQQEGRTQIEMDNKNNLAESLIAKQFYFELETLPIYSKGRYQCVGRLVCRFAGAQQLALLTQLSQNSAHFLLGERAITGVLQPSSGVFRETISFSVKGLDEEVSIFLASTSTKPRCISGFPTSMASLIRAQGLDTVFGVPNHSKRRAKYSAGPSQVKRQLSMT